MAAIFGGTIATTLLSFISLELAMMAFGIFAIGAVMLAEYQRRGFWEQAASFKFKSLSDNQKATAQNVRYNRKNIDALRDDVEALRASHSKPAAPVPSEDRFKGELPPGKPRHTPLPMNLDTKPLPRSPRALKPQSKQQDEPAMPEVNIKEDNYDSVSDTVVRELVQHAMHHKRVDVFVQPVMRLPQRQVRFYEMFGRIRARPGQYLPASRYMEIAEQDNLDGEIDNLLLLHCLKTIQGSAHIKSAAPFFINIKNSTLKNTAFMKRLLGFVSKNRDLAPRLIFEIRQHDFNDMSPALLEIMRGLGTLGCSFSLDHVESLKMDIADLQHFKIRFVKVAAQKLLGVQGDKEFAQMHKNKRRLEANGVGVIVEKIEQERDLRELLDYDIHYGQGYLFGKPDLEGAYRKQPPSQRKGLQGQTG
ncbi:MAG: EAL domain-containing protein [Pseudomonadota bacterium]